MSYMGDYKMRQVEEAEAAVSRAVDEAALAEEASRAKREIAENTEAAFDVPEPDATEQGYEEWQGQQIDSLCRNMIAAALGLQGWGWTKEDLRLALEDKDLI